MKISFFPKNELKEKPDFNNLSFGKHFTDYMFIMDYSTEKGWHDQRIVEYGPLSLDPSTMVLHYAQEAFEGLKAYKKGDKVFLFRPQENAKRFNTSLERLCMPIIKEEDFVTYIKELVKIEKDWIPTQNGSSLYIRPFIFASDPGLGVHVSNTYKFLIILSPSGQYYSKGNKINPVKIYVEDSYKRASQGGTGAVKCGGNYAASLLAQKKANDQGYNQVLWLDAKENKYVEEIGAMNVMFRVNNKIITPALHGSILPGITRDSIIKLLKHLNYEVEERLISIDELLEAHDKGLFQEAFGTGTAAVISPIGTLKYKDKEIILNNNETGEVSQKLYDTLTNIQKGEIEDPFGWVMEVK